jgi:hypothetical protein
VGEVVAQIRIDDLPLSTLRDVPKHLAYGHLRIQLRTEVILVSQHVRLEDGADHPHHRHLDHAVADGRNAERPLPAVALWDPHSQQGLRAVGGAVQLLHNPFQPLLSTPSLDLVERFADRNSLICGMMVKSGGRAQWRVSTTLGLGQRSVNIFELPPS